MKFSFGNVKRLTYNQTSYPITLVDVKAYSKWFETSPTDTSIDTWITNFVIPKAVEQFEAVSGYLILDQTFQASIRSLQSPVYKTFQAELIHLNIRSVNDVYTTLVTGITRTQKQSLILKITILHLNKVIHHIFSTQKAVIFLFTKFKTTFKLLMLAVLRITILQTYQQIFLKP